MVIMVAKDRNHVLYIMYQPEGQDIVGDVRLGGSMKIPMSDAGNLIEAIEDLMENDDNDVGG